MTESQYQTVVSLAIPTAPAPLLLLAFNPTRKRRPFWVKRLRWSAKPGDASAVNSIYPKLHERR